MATIQLGVINDIGIIRIAPFTAVELKCLASAVNADNSAALADAATESANAAAATALSYVGTSPTGAYANLAALQAAYPNGEDGVFVVKDTGYWYFWNGSAWEDGGEYQKDIPTTTIEELRMSDLRQMSAIKDVENTLNSININQETTNTVSGYGTISLPKNAANGGMSVKLEGLTAENLVVNGDFRNGFVAPWLASGMDAPSVSNKIVSFVATETNGRVTQDPSSAEYVVGDVWYVGAWVKANTSLISLLAFRVGEQYATVYYTNVGAWQLLSRVGAITDHTTPRVFGINDGRASGWDAVQCTGFFRINLTETFGAGNEPTKEQCDLMFSDYFEGVKSFEPTGRVRSVGRNLFDKDRAKYVYGYYTAAGSFISDASNKVNISILNNIKVAPSTLYRYLYPVGIVAARCVGYDKNGAFISEVFQDGANSGSFTTPANCEYIKIGFKRTTGLTINEVQTKGMHLQRTSIAPTAIEPYTESNLFLNAGELRSNGLVKDEIRKGANGYELVKRVGVGTLGSEKLTNGNFSNGATNWSTFGGALITDRVTFNGASWQGINQAITAPVSNTFFAYQYEVITTGTGALMLYAGDQNSRTANKSVGQHKAIIKGGSSNLILTLGGQNFSGEVDNISVKQITPLDGDPSYDSNSYYTDLGNGQILYTLATPEIIPISYGGVLNSAESGTVYHEPVIADAGVYDTNLPILMQDYPIASIEEIIKHEDGVDTYLDVSTAVIAPDGLSFTHPDLASGDLVLFTYAYDKESTSGNITATFYDSNVVKIDTATGTAYKIEDVVTDGVLTRTLTEV